MARLFSRQLLLAGEQAAPAPEVAVMAVRRVAVVEMGLAIRHRAHHLSQWQGEKMRKNKPSRVAVKTPEPHLNLVSANCVVHRCTIVVAYVVELNQRDLGIRAAHPFRYIACIVPSGSRNDLFSERCVLGGGLPQAGLKRDSSSPQTQQGAAAIRHTPSRCVAP